MPVSARGKLELSREADARHAPAAASPKSSVAVSRLRKALRNGDGCGAQRQTVDAAVISGQ